MNVLKTLTAVLSPTPIEVLPVTESESQEQPLDQIFRSTLTSELGLPLQNTSDARTPVTKFESSTNDLIDGDVGTYQTSGEASDLGNVSESSRPFMATAIQSRQGASDSVVAVASDYPLGGTEINESQMDVQVMFGGSTVLPWTSAERPSFISFDEVPRASDGSLNTHTLGLSPSANAATFPLGQKVQDLADGTTALGLALPVRQEQSLEPRVTGGVEKSTQNSAAGGDARQQGRGEVGLSGNALDGIAVKSHVTFIQRPITAKVKQGIPLQDAKAVDLQIAALDDGLTPTKTDKQTRGANSLAYSRIDDRVAVRSLTSKLGMQQPGIHSSESKPVNAHLTPNENTSILATPITRSYIKKGLGAKDGSREIATLQRSASRVEKARGLYAELRSSQVLTPQPRNSIFELSFDIKNRSDNVLATSWQNPDLQLQPTRVASVQLAPAMTATFFPAVSPQVSSLLLDAEAENETNAQSKNGIFQESVVKPLTFQLGSSELRRNNTEPVNNTEIFRSTSFNAQSWTDNASQRIALMVTRNLESAEIHIDPPELGPISVRIAMQNDQLSLQFASPHGQVRDFIEQHMNQLERLLEDQGLELGNTDVSAGNGRNDGENKNSEPDSPIIDVDEEKPAGKLTEGLGTASSQGNIDTFI